LYKQPTFSELVMLGYQTLNFWRFTDQTPANNQCQSITGKF